MKASHNFLKLYVKDLDVVGKVFSDRITMTGTKIETYEQLDKNLSKIVVAEIVKLEKHPDADKLVICQVNVGNNVIIQIVTGAQNVYEGMKCPCVLVGGKVAASAHDNKEYENGINIKEGKLRGVESYGMLCSIDELGRPKDLYAGEDGIYDLKEYDCKVGDDVIEIMGLNDYIYDFEITSNRIDCYSVKGIAKEVSATFNKEYKEPNTSFNATVSCPNYINVEVKDNDLCPLFYTRLIKNVKISESPEWLKNCLRACGVRPINNIVDITNFVMLEYGQPMHAYDYSTIKDKKIIVKRAEQNEEFVTLDGIKHTLNNTMLTINDGKSAIGLAGIMGGENTMITDSVQDVLFEAANFNGVNIRKTAKALGLRTEASNLFEKGLDPNNAILAINRACALVEELKCGEISKEQVFYEDEKQIPKQKEVIVSIDKINNLIGYNFDIKDVKQILDKIDLLTKIDGNNLIITVPTIRKDINNFADVAEEVIRFYGYDKIGTTLPNVNIIPSLMNKTETINDILYNTMLCNGFNEAMNYSFESEKVYDKLMYKNDALERNYIKILNPLGEDFSIMRTQLINGVLNSLANNFKRNIKDAKLFEVANIYLPKDTNMNELPDERKTLTFGAYGKNIDFFYMKAVINELFERLSINNIKFIKNENISFLHPYRTADIYYNDNKIGYLGEVHKLVNDNYGIETKVYISSIYINSLQDISNFESKYYEISKFPKVYRDISMLVPIDTTINQIEEIIIKKSGKLLDEYNLFDIYVGAQVKDGFKSIAYNLSFLSKDHTLTDEEIDKIMEKIINGLKEINIELRS